MSENQINMIVFEYGDQMEPGIGSYDHPAGGSCALQIMTVMKIDNDHDASEDLKHFLSFPEVHSIIITEPYKG